MSDRDPAPVATVGSLTVTQHNDLREAIRNLSDGRHHTEHAIKQAFLRGIASQRDEQPTKGQTA